MAKRHTRRTPGTGYTTKAPNGTSTAYFPKRGGGYHVRRGFDTSAAAEAWLDSLLTQRDAKLDVGSGQQRVGTWMDRWAERAAKDREWKAKMVADVAYKLGYVKPYLGSMALADVLPDHVDAMLDELGKDLAQTTVRQIRNYLYQVFEEARGRRYITFNPVLKPQRRKRAKQREPQRLSAAQAASLLAAADDSFYGVAWWLILSLGMRAGEVCGLRRGDIDFERATLTIAQEATDVRGTVLLDTPKGDKERTVPIPRALLPLLQQHLQHVTRRAAQGMQRGTWHEHGLVFPGRSGKPMNPTSLRHMLKRLTDARHLPPVTTHMLRHTASSLYTAVNCPENLIAALLGHAPSTITRHYAQPDVETLRGWVEQVYRLLDGEVERGQRSA
ncbi:MAG TPA: site-specific integrase [Roseiflexaceae bacterium]|nr:site-specific integrase [Roseiflexaceae bacterium]